MDSWRVAVLGDGGVGKTALAVQFTLNCFVEVCRSFPRKDVTNLESTCFRHTILP
ncbi:hypothetical protein QCA50_001573 [Cerrena zonata]|uniref:Uncharacterized protein n=1 Tax=Cerrena zonata TaxID=2478898 RepID=A0AAW0GNZ2_9APHY